MDTPIFLEDVTEFDPGVTYQFVLRSNDPMDDEDSMVVSLGTGPDGATRAMLDLMRRADGTLEATGASLQASAAYSATRLSRITQRTAQQQRSLERLCEQAQAGDRYLRILDYVRTELTMDIPSLSAEDLAPTHPAIDDLLGLDSARTVQDLALALLSRLVGYHVMVSTTYVWS